MAPHYHSVKEIPKHQNWNLTTGQGHCMILAPKVEGQKQLWDPRYSPPKAELFAWPWFNSGMKHLGHDDFEFGRDASLNTRLLHSGGTSPETQFGA
jgi:hypothetical protein